MDEQSARKAALETLNNQGGVPAVFGYLRDLYGDELQTHCVYNTLVRLPCYWNP